MKPVLLGSLAMLALGYILQAAAVASEPETSAVPDFTLSRFDSTNQVSRRDYAGGIVVLDFFAYWCPPCRDSAPKIEQGIQHYYNERSGNSHGVPVTVISASTDQSSPAKTKAFIASTGVSLPVDDLDGALLEKFAGTGLPFLVVLDGTAAKQDPAAWRVVHRGAGFPGVAKLRAVIDAIAPPPANVPTPSKTDAAQVLLVEPIQLGGAPSIARQEHPIQSPSRAMLGAPVQGAGEPTVCDPNNPHCAASASSTDHLTLREAGTDLAEISFDALWSDDVRLSDTTLSYRRQKGRGDLKLGISIATFDLDYRNDPSTDPLGVARTLTETRTAIQARYQHRVAEPLSLFAGGSYYEGFTDYRNLWLSEYYRQQFDFFPTYEAPDPRGWSGSGGARWEYLPATGFVEVEGAFRRDHVAPGYELEFQPGPPPRTVLLQGREILDSVAGRVRFENVVSRRLRSLLDFQITDTTDRELRYTAQGTLHIALAEDWVARVNGGYTRETPALTAWWLGGTIEHDWDNRWFLGVTGRYYTDTGYLENSGLISDATPELATYHAALSLRWQGQRAGFRLTAGPYYSRYSGAGPGTLPFVYLYQDRNWFQVQAAFSFQF